MPKKNRSIRKEWKKKLELWKQSSLSGRRWCVENNEHYSKFCYWKQALQPSAKPPLFKELKEEPQETMEIELKKGDVTIAFPKGCSPTLLELCLKTLRKVHC